jgi:UDP-N-acetylmuramoylalanine--D-glutamate ligase
MTALVAGLGVSGASVMRFFAAQGTSMRAYDTREQFDASSLRADFPNVPLTLGTLPTPWRKDTDLLVLSPGIDPRAAWVRAFVDQGVEVVGDVELFCRAIPNDKPVIAITGSNGKSTVTTLVGELLTAQGYRVGVGGNLGRPALDLLSDDVDVFVLELSSFQLETTRSLNAIAATILNLSPDHLDRYEDMAAYVAAKAPIYAMTHLAVVNSDDALAAQQCPSDVPQMRFSLSVPTQNGDCGVMMHQGELWLALWVLGAAQAEPWFPVARLRLMGRHNWSNVLAALALCQPLGLSPAAAESVLASFNGLPHRAQRVADIGGVTWVNDSKGTNVGSTLSAMQSLGASARIVLLAGGDGKGQDFSPLAAVVKTYARALIVYGRDGAQIAQACAGADDMHCVDTLEQAVALAYRLAQNGDVVLLSPASASFDQFKHYVHRGEVFTALVEALV